MSWWPRISHPAGSGGSACGEVGADVCGVGWALFGLSLGKLEEWPCSAQPMLESLRGVFQAVLQGDALGNGWTVEWEERVELAVDDGGLLARDCPDEGLLVILAFVQVLVACIPLGASCCLEVHGDQFDGLAALVVFGGLLLGA
jgi:hypothetical protein